MVSFLKLPFKFRQVIYLIYKASLVPFFFFFEREHVLITRSCTVFCLAYLNVSQQYTHLDQCHWAFVLSICTVLRMRHLGWLPLTGQDCRKMETPGWCRAGTLPTSLQVDSKA